MAINFPSTNLYNGYTHVVGDVTFTYNSTKTLWEPSTAAPTIHNTPVDGSDTIAISSNWAFDSVKTIVPENALFTDTEVDWTTAQSGSVIDSSNIPVIALTSIQTAANEAAQLALTTQEGDVVVRTDENKNYIRNNGVVGTMADFTALATPIDATGWTGGAYNASDGKITFSSDDGLGFVTDDLRGASTEFSGSGAGLVPNITPANSTKFLRADGSWVVPTDTQVTVNDTLTSTSTTDALSANQGKELKTLVDAVGSGGGSGGLSSRSTAATATLTISDDVIENVTFTGFKSYMLMGIQTSAAAWVRLYTNSPARIADATRGEGEDPGPDAGVIAEVLSNGAQTIGFSPGVLGWNTANDTTIYAAVKNKSGSSLAITTTLTLLQLEA
jgi:hypothetical protein